MYTHTTQKQHLTKKHSRHSSRIARKVDRAAQTKEARERNLAAVQLKEVIPVEPDCLEREADQVADQVVSRQPAPRITHKMTGGGSNLIRRVVDADKKDQAKEVSNEVNVPDFRAHVPSPTYYQRFAALQGLQQFQMHENDDERNRLIELYEALAAREPGSYTGNAYELTLKLSTTARSNIIAAASSTPTDSVSNRTRWALQVNLLAYMIKYGLPELNTSFVYEWHDFAFRFAGDSPTIGKIPWLILGYVDFPGIGEFIGGKGGSEKGAQLIGWTIYALNQPDGSIPTWALPLRMALDALGSSPEVFYGEMLRPVFFHEPVQRKAVGNLAIENKWLAASMRRPELQASANVTLSQVLHNSQSGSPIMPVTRMRLESNTGADLSAVRVHDDAAARQLTSTLNARAFTHGNNIWLGSGESQHDLWLMAHEATHVIQQQREVRLKPIGGVGEKQKGATHNLLLEDYDKELQKQRIREAELYINEFKAKYANPSLVVKLDKALNVVSEGKTNVDRVSESARGKKSGGKLNALIELFLIISRFGVDIAMAEENKQYGSDVRQLIENMNGVGYLPSIELRKENILDRSGNSVWRWKVEYLFLPVENIEKQIASTVSLIDFFDDQIRDVTSKIDAISPADKRISASQKGLARRHLILKLRDLKYARKTVSEYLGELGQICY